MWDGGSNTFAKVVSNKENVIDVAVANASKAKTLLCVSCMQSVLIPCHDKCVAKHKLNARSNARRTFSVNSRIPKSSKTTFVASKSKIDEASASKARDKFESQPNVIWTPVNTKPHAHTNPSNRKPLVSVKRWIGMRCMTPTQLESLTKLSS
ncbi:hypothetical protein Tco_1364186 [Tanacetum coccineum]